jgi:O-antigen ligase
MISFLPFAVFPVAARGRPLRRALAAGAACLMIGAIVVTQSRSGAVGLSLVLVVIAAMLIARKPAVLGAALLAAIVALPFVPDSYWQRVASIGNEQLDDTGSREARRVLLREAYEAFLARPLTGVGVGQFRNYDPDGRQEPWRETHNVVLQLAADLGIFGPLIFFYLCWRGVAAARRSRRLLREIRRHPERAVLPLTAAEAASLDLHITAVTAAMIGWFICAQFASVAYNWTFYYVLALAVVPREILRARLVLRRQPAAPAAPMRVAEAAV